MKIKFCGGANQVTGSNFLIDFDTQINTEHNTEKHGLKILVDCGLIQATNTCELENFELFSYNPQEIDLVLITHAHLDHIGRLPKLVKEGFSGKILSTLPTKELAKEVLSDALKIVQEECGKELFSPEDLEKTLEQWETINYHQVFPVNNFIRENLCKNPCQSVSTQIEFFDAGHILGSAFIKLSFTTDKHGYNTRINTDKKIRENPCDNQCKSVSVVFSGDLGNNPNPLLKDTENLPKTDFVVTESTYGDRNHKNPDKRKEILEDILENTIKNKGVLIIPAFAIERTQEILFEITELIENSKIPIVPIFLDSPLALKTSKIFQRHLDYFNETAKKRFLGDKILDCPNLNVIAEKQDEVKIFNSVNPKIIIAGSGMLTGGRILNLLKHYISNPNTTLLFVSFQVKGSLGRKILDGEKNIEIQGEKLIVSAKIEKLLDYSDHKDQQGILNWLSPQKRSIKKIFLVHADNEPKQALKAKIIDNLSMDVEIPHQDEIFEL